jgi:hypothetical protein
MALNKTTKLNENFQDYIFYINPYNGLAYAIKRDKYLFFMAYGPNSLKAHKDYFFNKDIKILIDFIQES